MTTTLAKPRNRWANNFFWWQTLLRSLPWLALLTGLGITFLVWHNAQTRQEHEQRARFQRLLHETGTSIKERMRIYEQVLRGVQGWIGSAGQVERAKFQAYVEKLALEQHYPGIQGVGFSVLVAPAQRQAHIQQIRAEGFPNYVIFPQGERTVYTSVVFLEPFSPRNQRAFGYDMYADQGVRREAMDFARDQGRPAMSGIVTLLMENDQNVQPGFLMFLPVYKNGMPTGTVNERRAALQGWVYAPFRVHDLIQGILKKSVADDGAEVAIQIHDDTPAKPQNVVYRGTMAANFMAAGNWQKSMVIDVANRQWTILLSGLPFKNGNYLSARSINLAAVGVAISVLVALIVWLLATLHSQALKVTNAMRLSTLVYKNSNQGMVVSDANHNIVSVNPAFTAITGFTERDVIGKNPRIWSSGRHNQAFYQNMWHELHEKKQWQGEIWNRRKNGDVFAEHLVLNAIINHEGQVEGYVALFSDLTEKMSHDDLIWRQINFDSLTGYPNRNLLQERLAMEIHRSQADAASFAFLLIDLDNFKNINDTLGHHVGDLLLIELAHRLAACIGEADTLARFGGDEFAIIYHPPTDQQNAALLAQQIIQGLTVSFSVDGETVYTSVSIGMTFYPQEAADVAELLKNADQALFRAKSGGRNRFAYFTPEMQLLAQERLRLEKDLRHALEREQLRVYFQPIIDLASGNIFKAEALLRWQHPERGLISPALFIPLAEESGLINPIGDWVFYEAAKWSNRWSQLLGRTFQISVNKSPVQFYATTDAGNWIDHLRGHGMPGASIAIEITEGLLLNADGKVGEQLTQYVAAGMEVSIDDFGTGYSSLAYLKKFHIDYLKIDQSFIRDMTTNPVDRTIVETTIMMAHRLEFKVIAEGIENPWQAAILTELGCEYGQGYLFSRPVPAHEFEALLVEKKNLKIRAA